MSKPSLQSQFFQVREDAIVAAVNRLLAEKGFDLMTVDEVAAEVGIGKASLYKHFASKEDLGAAAMAFVLKNALAHAARLEVDEKLDGFSRLEAMARWAVERQLRGEMPALPAQNPSLRAAMGRHSAYMEQLIRLSDQLGRWIDAARHEGRLNLDFPAELTLYTLFAKGCDPVVLIMKQSGQYTDAQIVEWAVRSCFAGLAGTIAAPSRTKS